jgi:hypothetical protein
VSSSWLQASHVWVNAMAAGCEGKGKTMGTPTLWRFGSVKGLTWCMDRGFERPPPPPPSTTPEGFGSGAWTGEWTSLLISQGLESLESHDDYGKGKGKGSHDDYGKGKGMDRHVVESLDSHDDHGKGKGKGQQGDRRASTATRSS